MREYRAALDNAKIPVSSLDTAIELLLIALLAFMPLALGVRTARGEEVVIALSGIIVICFLLKLLVSGSGPIWTWAYVPVGLFVLVAAFQLLPVPARLASIISGNTVALRTELLGDLPNAEKLLKSAPLSFYLNDTRHDLRLLLAVAAVFAVVFNVFRRPEQIKRLLLAIAVIGGGVAAIALAQDLFGNGKIYWFIPSPHPNTFSGPFINHSHYGQFMNLSIGAALGWLCVRLREDFSGRRTTPSAVYEYLGSDSARGLWLLVAMMVLGTATIFISLTRGGMLSMLAAAAFVTLLLTTRPSLKSHGWIMVVTAIGAFACILYIGFDAVYDRFASLRHLQEYQARWQILKDLTASYRQFPVLGTGLGTHAVVYPMFKHINSALLFTHAENEYAQVMEETGLVGLAALILLGVAVWSSFARSVRKAGSPVCFAAYGLGFGLVAVLIHSLSDFGQHVPANAFLSAIFCALLLSLAQQTSRQPVTTCAAPSKWNSRWTRVVISVAVCGIWVWALVGADNARKAEARWEQALEVEKGLRERKWQASDAEYAALIRHAAAASNYQPQNVLYRYWLNVYRWRSISQAADPKTGQVIVAAGSMPTVRDIVDEFHKACALCPTYGPPYSVVGQIERFILNDDSGSERIRRGFRLARSDPVTCMVAGHLDILEGETQNCFAKFEKAVQLDGSLFKDVAAIYVYRLSRPHLAISLAGDDIGRLAHVANLLDDMQYRDLAAQARERITSLLEAKCSGADASGGMFASLGNIYGKQKRSEAAAECYRQALVREYGQVHWRLELAKLFAQMGRQPEAIHQAKICLQLKPQFKAAEELVADLSVHPEVLRRSIESQ